MEKTKFNDEIEKLFAKCINWAITGSDSWHFRATNLMSEMNQEIQTLSAELAALKKERTILSRIIFEERGLTIEDVLSNSQESTGEGLHPNEGGE